MASLQARVVGEEAAETASSQLLATVVGLLDLGLCRDRKGGIAAGEERLCGGGNGFSLALNWDGVDSGEGEDDQDGGEDGGGLELHV